MINLKVKTQTSKDAALNIYGDTDVPVFACISKGITPDNVINFVDTTEIIPENNLEYNSSEKIFPKLDSNGNSKVEYLLPGKYKYMGKSLIATDISTESKLQDYSIPLFFSYELMYDHYSQDPMSPEGFITIRKNNDISMDSSLYKIQRRPFPIASGRYINNSASGYIWGYAASGQITTCRVLLPKIEEQDDFYTVEYNRNINNVTSEYWKELVSERRIYEKDSDYTLTPSSLILTANSRMSSGNAIFVSKDPFSFIHIRPIHDNTESAIYREWNISLNIGEFVACSGLAGEGTTTFFVNNDYGSDSYEYTDEAGDIISKNIIRTDNFPIKEDYHNYIIPVSEYIYSGSIKSLLVNGEDRVSNIKSIDFNRGFIFLDKEVKDNDEVILNYVADCSGNFPVKNLQLNPTDTYSGVIDVTQGAIGLALVPSGAQFMAKDSSLVTFSNVVVYNAADEENLGDFSNGNISGFALSSYNSTWDPNQPISGIIPSGSKLLGFISLNKPLKDNIELIDIRRKGGYEKLEVKNLVSGWRNFSDIGNWDGEPMPLAGTVLIQIPNFVYDRIYEIFKRETME